MATDPGLDGDESISSRSHNLIRKLHDLIDLLKEKEATGNAVIPPTSVSDILDRFLLWCGNLGALHKPTKKLSLDQRLADASEVKNQVLVNIDDFNEAIEDLSGIILGDNPNREIPSSDDGRDLGNDENGTVLHDGDKQEEDFVREDSQMDEAHMNLELMAEAMKSLFQLGVLVRKSGPRDRFQKALQQSTSFPESFDIDYVEQKYLKLYQAEDRWLSQRLGSSNAKRRQFIKYCREHKARLDAYDDTLPIRDGGTEKLSSKATTFVNNIEPRPLEPLSGDDDAISIMTATTTFNADTKLKLPSLAELSSGEDHFECPICFTLQSIDTEKAWKIHAFRDLKAYVCTVGGKECNSLFFSDRNAWFEHELQNHRSRYNCTLCDQKGFRSKDSFMEHISSAHGSFPRGQLSALAEASCVVPSQFNTRDCPICDDWAAILENRQNIKGKRVDASTVQDVFVPAAKFKRHVATHLEQLAIFVVPRSSDPDAEESTGSHYSISQLYREGISPNDQTHIGRDETDEFDKYFDFKNFSITPEDYDSFEHTTAQEAQGNATSSFESDNDPSGDEHIKGPGVVDEDLRPSSNPNDVNYVDVDSVDDVLAVKISGHDYRFSFPKASIRDGKLRVIDLRDRIGKTMNISAKRTHRINMSYHGRDLRDMQRSLQSYGVTTKDEIQVVLPKLPSSENGSDGESREAEVKDSVALREFALLEDHFDANILPMVREFSANPPSEPRILERDHRKISEAIMQQILLKADNIDSGGDPRVRLKRKELVNSVQNVLRDIDKHLPGTKKS